MQKYFGFLFAALLAAFPVTASALVTVPPPGLALIQQPQPEKSDKPPAQGQPDKREESRGARENDRKELAADRSAWLEAIGVAVAAIFTAVLAVATITLWYQTKKLAEFAAEQARDMKSVIAASQKSAYAAEKSNSQFQINAQMQLRAYVNVLYAKKSKFPEIGDEFGEVVVTVRLKNFGATPANDFEFDARLVCGTKETLAPVTVN